MCLDNGSFASLPQFKLNQLGQKLKLTDEARVPGALHAYEPSKVISKADKKHKAPKFKKSAIELDLLSSTDVIIIKEVTI